MSDQPRCDCACSSFWELELSKAKAEIVEMDKKLKAMATKSTDWEIRAKEAEAKLRESVLL